MTIITRSIHNNTLSPIDLFVPGYESNHPPVVIAPGATVDLFTLVSGDELEAMQDQLAKLVAVGSITVTAMVNTTTFSPVGGGGGSNIFTQILTTDTTAVVPGAYFFNTGMNDVTLTLPLGASVPGQLVYLAHNPND